MLLHPCRICSVTAAGGPRSHHFLPHVPSETLALKIVGVSATWEHDSASAVLDLDFFKSAPRVWCDDSHGAVHKRIRGRQRCLQQELGFNSFVLRRPRRNKAPIFRLGFRLLFVNAFLIVSPTVVVFSSKFACADIDMFRQFVFMVCFGVCVAKLAADGFPMRFGMPAWCFKAALLLQ